MIEQDSKAGPSGESLQGEAITGVRLDAALRESEEQYRLLFEKNPTPMYVFDRETLGFLAVNEAAIAHYGYSREEFRDLTIKDLRPAEEVPALLDSLAKWATEPTMSDLETAGFWRHRKKGGTIILMHIIRAAVSFNGRPAGLVLAQDVTERRKAEEERARYIAQLQAMGDVSLAITSMRSLHDVLKIVTEKAREVIGAHMAITGMTLDGNWDQAITAASFSERYAAYGAFDARPEGAGIYSLVCQSNRPVRMTQPEMEAHPRWRGFGRYGERHPPLRGWLAAPLTGRVGQNLGLIQLSDKYEGDFTAADETLLVQLAQLASVAIENARLLEAERGQRRVAEAEAAERERAEAALRESEERLRQVTEHIREVFWMTDVEMSQILYVSPAYGDIWGRTCASLYASPLSWLEAIHPEDRGRVKRAVLEKQATGTYDETYRIVRPDGSIRWIRDRAFPIRDVGGAVYRVAGIAEDITGQKLTEERLQSSLKRLRELSQRMEAVRESERARIAREVHDELGGTLTCLKLDLSRLPSATTGADTEETRSRLQQRVQSMVELVDHSISVVQRIATELRPGVLDDLGLVAALEWQAQDFQARTGIACRFLAETEDLLVDRERATALFRICQEALINVVRHAQATGVVIQVTRTAGQVVLRVEDNGRGIPEDRIEDPHSLGLLGMRERVTSFGGQFHIKGTPGAGTTLSVGIPLG